MSRSSYSVDLAKLIRAELAKALPQAIAAAVVQQPVKREQPAQLARYQQQRKAPAVVKPAAVAKRRQVVVHHTATAPAPAASTAKKARVFTLTADEFQQSIKNRDLSMVEVQTFLHENCPTVLPYTVVRGRWLWIVGMPKPDNHQSWCLKFIGFKPVNYAKYGRGWEWGHRCGVQKRNFRPCDPEQVHGHQPLA